MTMKLKLEESSENGEEENINFSINPEAKTAQFNHIGVRNRLSLRSRGNMSLNYAQNKEEKKEIDNRVESFFNKTEMSYKNRIHMVPHRTNQAKIVDQANVGVYYLDSLITTQHDLTLSVKSADCPPILAVSKNKNLVSLINGGISSITGNIVEKTFKKIYSEFLLNPADFTFYIGPGICSNCYQLDFGWFQLGKIAKMKLQGWGKNTSFWKKRIALIPEIKRRIKSLEPNRSLQIYSTGICTYHSRDTEGELLFPSHFRSKKNNRKESRFIAAVRLN